MQKEKVETILKQHGYADFRWVRGKDVVVAQWVRFKCMFGCSSYGQKGTCPPQVPSVTECREFFCEYEHLVVIHFEKKVDQSEDRVSWSRKVNLDLLKVEKELFLADYSKAFLLFMDECRICKECSGSRDNCTVPTQARPGPEALAVDVYTTVRRLGYPIQVLSDYDQEMNRYAFLLVE